MQFTYTTMPVVPADKAVQHMYPAEPCGLQMVLSMQVSNMVSRELDKECVIVFDEAHNIDNVCIEVGSHLSLP